MSMGPNMVLDKGLLANDTTAYRFGHIVVQQAARDGQSMAKAVVGTNVTLASNLAPFYVCMEDIDAARVATGKAVLNCRILGIARVLAGATFPQFARIVPDGTSRGVAQTRAAAGAQPIPVLGIAMKPATAVDQLVEVLIVPGLTW